MDPNVHVTPKFRMDLKRPCDTQIFELTLNVHVTKEKWRRAIMRVTNLLREDVTCPLAPGSVNNIVSADMISTGVLLHPHFRIVFVFGFILFGQI